MTQKQKTHHLAVAAMLCAVAFVLQFIEFSIPLIPSFVKLDLSDLPALLGTFSLGPVYGVVIQLVKNLLHLPFGSSAGVGELSNFLLGSVFVLVAGLVYRRHKSRKSALWGSLLGAVLMALVSLPSNYFVVYPAYEVLYGLPMTGIVGMYEAIMAPSPTSPPAIPSSTACWCSTSPLPCSRACWMWASASSSTSPCPPCCTNNIRKPETQSSVLSGDCVFLLCSGAGRGIIEHMVDFEEVCRHGRPGDFAL